jgi:hypothetical protein
VAPIAREAQPEVKKPSVITKSVPVKRGGRRNEIGRVPRVPLYAPASDVSPTEEVVNANAQSPVLETSLPPVETPTIITDVLEAGANAPSGNSRNKRSRGGKGRAQGDRNAVENADAAPAHNEEAKDESRGSSVENSDANEPGRERENLAAVPNKPDTPAVTATAPAPHTAVPAATPAPPRRSSRPKRPASGARAEKPAVDTPVIPVPDPNQLRTQVAAGRMSGSSATLIEPTAESTAANLPSVKKTAAPKKAAPKAKASQPANQEAAAEPAAPKAPATPPKKAPAKKATVAKPKAAAAPDAAAPKPAPKPRAPRKPAKPA